MTASFVDSSTLPLAGGQLLDATSETLTARSVGRKSFEFEPPGSGALTSTQMLSQDNPESSVRLSSPDLLVAKQRAMSRRLTSSDIPYSIEGLERWQGIVAEIDETVFTARIARSTGENGQFEADFPVQLVRDTEQDLFRRGAVFYLTVRTIYVRRGMPSRTASIAFRRLGKAAYAAIATLSEEAQVIADELATLVE